MEDYIVSARKYRPAHFGSVIGQEALTTTLNNAIATGKLAQAYLFCGPRGVGKTTCARIFAKTINCMSPRPDGSACDECESCRAFNEGRSLNIHELDAASNNSVDDIRQLVDQVRIPPQIGKYKVYIIDEVHMLSASAFNAFLKTLEEPPRHAVFILATTEKQKILPTILSRCQIYDFNRISVEDIVRHLASVADKEGVSYEPEALNVIAQKADGGMRDALSIFDQVVSFCRGNITYKGVIENLNVLDYEYYFRLTDCLLQGNVTGSLLLFNEILDKGFDGGNFVNGLGSHFRDLLVSKDASTVCLLEVGASIRNSYIEQSKRCPLPFLYRSMKICLESGLKYKESRNKRFLVECTLIQLAQGDNTEKKNDTLTGTPPSQTLKPISDGGVAGATASPEQTTSVQTPSAVKPATQPATAQTAATASAQTASVTSRATAAPQQQDMATLLAQKSRQKDNVKVIKAGNLLGLRTAATPASGNGLQTDGKQQPKPYSNVPDEPLTEAGVKDSWIGYARQMPKEQVALARRMQSMGISLKDGKTVDVPVENELAAKEINALKPEIQSYMQQQLHNHGLTISVRIAEVEKSGMAYSRSEQYKMMAEKNSLLAELRKRLELDLT